jgi:hypothetical protein
LLPPLHGAGLVQQVGILSRRRYPLSAASQAMMNVLLETFSQTLEVAAP